MVDDQFKELIERFTPLYFALFGLEKEGGQMMISWMLIDVTSSLCSFFLRFGRRNIVKLIQEEVLVKVKVLDQAKALTIKDKITLEKSELSTLHAAAGGPILELDHNCGCVTQEIYWISSNNSLYASIIFVFWSKQKDHCIWAQRSASPSYRWMRWVYDKIDQLYKWMKKH